MSNQQRTNINIYFPFLTLLGVLLIILKLGSVMPVAAWSWWIITLPFWITFALALAWFVIGVIIILCATIIAYLLDR